MQRCCFFQHETLAILLIRYLKQVWQFSTLAVNETGEDKITKPLTFCSCHAYVSVKISFYFVVLMPFDKIKEARNQKRLGTTVLDNEISLSQFYANFNFPTLK